MPPRAGGRPRQCPRMSRAPRMCRRSLPRTISSWAAWSIALTTASPCRCAFLALSQSSICTRRPRFAGTAPPLWRQTTKPSPAPRSANSPPPVPRFSPSRASSKGCHGRASVNAHLSRLPPKPQSNAAFSARGTKPRRRAPHALRIGSPRFHAIPPSSR